MSECILQGNSIFLTLRILELEQLLSNGVLNDIPTYFNFEITAIQVFGISTLDLISTGSNPETARHGM